MANEANAFAVFRAALKLGLSSFGGPVAHIGYFREEYVARRKWMDDSSYADLVALCQFLPGPASSQVGIGIGLMRAGLPGAIAAWIGFTLPSAVALVLFALALDRFSLSGEPWLHGLKIVAVAVVAQAVLAMTRSLCPDIPRRMIALAAATVVLLAPSAPAQVAVILAAGAIGRIAFASGEPLPYHGERAGIGRSTGIAALAIFLVLLALGPVLRALGHSPAIAFLDSLYRVGSLVFGGGHVVLPLLQNEVVGPGWVNGEAFIAGYGAAQAVPGPLFSFAAYLGAVSTAMPGPLPGSLLALVAIFLPSFLLVAGVLPFWSELRARPGFQSALKGVNAAVVGLLFAAFLDPVCAGAIRSPVDVAIAAIGFVLLVAARVPSWGAVIALAALAQVIAPWS